MVSPVNSLKPHYVLCEHVIRDAQSNTCTLASTDTEAIMLETLSC